MSFFSFTTKSPTDLNAEEFKSKMDQDTDAVLLDVRSAGEVAEGMIEDAEHIDFFSPSLNRWVTWW
jgi:predicted sulfurtransferase